MDARTTLDDLRTVVERFIAARNWEGYHSPKNLAISIAIEAGEIMEHFQWCTAEESRQLVSEPTRKAEVADELADVVIYCLSLANQLDVDLSKAVLEKLERNEGRFPVGYVPKK